MSTKRQYTTRVVAETDPGTRPGATNMTEVNLPGVDVSIQRAMTQSLRVNKDLVPRRGTKGPKNITFQSTTDFGFRYGGEPILLSSAFGSPEIPSVLGSADSIVDADNAIVRNGGWGPIGVTAGQMILVSGAAVNPPLFLAPVVEIVGNQARIDPDFIDLADEVTPLSVNHAGSFRVGGETRTLTLESWNGTTARGDEVNGVYVNSWGFNVQFGQQGGQPVQQSFGFSALKHQLLTAQIPETTNQAPEALAFESGGGFQDKANPLAGFGVRFNGTVLEEILWDQVQLQMQAPIRPRAGAGHDEWQRLIRDQDVQITLTLTFGRRERIGYTHQDLLIGSADAGDAARIGFGFRDALSRRAYCYAPILEPESVRYPGQGSGDDTVTVTYKGYAEDTELWGPLFLAFFDPPAP